MNNKSKDPFLMEFPKIGNSALGYISVSEGLSLPFPVQRLYWTYFTPEEVNRGHHAHHELQQVLIAVSGRITVKTESPGGEVMHFTLEKPNVGLYLPKMCWHEMSYSHNAVQVCIASMEYAESDYIRNYADFKRIAANAGISKDR